jgi:glycosyltransferase involved in cell wall biosynthesis
VQTSVIIPAYNEEKVIGLVLDSIPRGYEIIVVNDGSTDETKQIAEKHPKVKVVSHSQKKGKGAALKTGIENSTGDILVFIDGDNQFDSKEIPRLINLIQEGEADLVLGVRDFSTIPLARRITNELARFAIWLITNQKFKDPLIGFRAVSRKSIQQTELRRNDFGIDTEMLIKAKKIGCIIEEIPITVNYNTGKSYFGIRDGIKLVSFFLVMFLTNLFS